MLIFYYIGRNIFHIFNNIWESFFMNKLLLKLLSLERVSTKCLEFYTQGFYFNLMSRSNKQSILISEVLVILTIGVFFFS